MRTSFMHTITELAEKDSAVMLVISDNGFGVFENFEKNYGARFVNVGIAEQQLIEFAAGLALSGMKVFVYNICSFMTRAMEQIRLELSYQQAPVILVGGGGGLWYATEGPTYHAIEDISLFRSLPNMTIICPADPIEMREAVIHAYHLQKPCYIRICKNNDDMIHKNKIDFKIGRSIVIKEGQDATIIATGGMVKEAMLTAAILEKRKISVGVVSMHTVKPLDRERIISCANQYQYLFVMEENNIIGGLGSAVAEMLIHERYLLKGFYSFGFPDQHAPTTGTRDFLNQLYKIDPLSMSEKIESIIRGIKVT